MKTTPYRPSLLSELHFDPARGFGFMPFADAPCYDEAYFNKYVVYGQTAFGVALNSLRVGLVSQYLPAYEALVDIGVGDGSFIRARGPQSTTYGYDINPVAVEMLTASKQWCDIQLLDAIPSASFWDSLEHITDAGAIVGKVSRYCFVSMPVFRDESHILSSKHLRPDEHCWYFTRYGLISWFWDLGFVCDEINDMETALGREDIGTFVFSRRKKW